MIRILLLASVALFPSVSAHAGCVIGATGAIDSGHNCNTGVTTAGVNPLDGQYPQKIITLTPGATVTPALGSGGGEFDLSINQNTVLACPTGGASGYAEVFWLRVIQPGTANYTLSYDTSGCYNFPFQTPFTLTARNDAVDQITFKTNGTASVDGASILQDLGPNIYAIGGHTPGTTCTDNTTNCAAPAISVTNGNKLIVFTTGCADVSCVNPKRTVSSWSGSNFGSCVALTGAAFTGANYLGIAYICNVTGTGSATVTANFSGVAYYAQTVAFEVAGLASSPDDGVGAAVQTSSAGTITVTTSGNTTQSNEFIFSITLSTMGSTISNISDTTIDNDNSLINTTLVQYRRVSASGVTHAMSASTTASGGGYAIIVALKHP
jgi:hypothetical protein